MTERRGTKALELWCRRITDGYPGVNVQNMTTSWRDGLAFCAMIHHFRPDLIDFDSLNKDDVYGNNEMAFRTAAEHLGIPALLDAEDMASCSVPDRLSILTYLAQFYQNFGGSSPSRLALSRTKETTNEGISPVVPESTKPKMGPRVGMRREPCAVCGMPVFLAEKLVISRTPYHRTCFRCARCNNQLTPGNYYETVDGQYCCETCPDEESLNKNSSSNEILHEAYNDAVNFVNNDQTSQPDGNTTTTGYRRSLSDEEKTEIKSQLTVNPTHTMDHRGGESSIAMDHRNFNECPSTEIISQTAQMRFNFMASQMLSENIQNDEKKMIKNDDEYSAKVEIVDEARTMSSPSPSDVSDNRRGSQGSTIDETNCDEPVDATKMPSTHNHSREDNFVDNLKPKLTNFHDHNNLIDDNNVKLNNLELNDTTVSFDTATNEATNLNHNKCNLDINEASIGRNTKDILDSDINDDANDRANETTNTTQCLSLVQRRLRVFENSGIIIDEKKNIVERKTRLSNDSIVDDESSTRAMTMEDDKNDVTTFDDEDIDSSFMNDDRNDESRDLDDSMVSEILETRVPPIVPKRQTRMKTNQVTVLNATGIDLSEEMNYPKNLNPFGSDEDDNVDARADERVEDVLKMKKASTNPFGSSDDEDDEATGTKSSVVALPRPAARWHVAGKNSSDETSKNADDAPTKRRLKAPQINLNPFWSDDEEERDSEDENGVHSLTVNTPVPKPRTITQTPHRRTESDRSEIYASNSSLGSTGSASTPGGTFRKKKPAPPPPVAKELFVSGNDFSLTPNRRPHMGSTNSLHTTPRARKTKPAPPPPMMPTSTPCGTNLMANLTLGESPITEIGKTMESGNHKTWDDLKIGKDEANRNKQSMTTISCNDTDPYGGYTDKSVQGKWKRKKGPAPARPTPHRRKIKVMSLKDVKLELDEIEVQQQGLERQGVRLEQLIRDKAETGIAAEETNLGIDVEELVLELFVLVNEKNELFRRQAELMLLRRQQRLEEEHADIEYQIRCLLCQPEATKTDFDKQREETLIQRLVEIVERRNEIVECLEMDRRREVEEDRSINTRMGAYTAKNKDDFAKDAEDEDNHRSQKTKKIKLKDRAKEKILRKGHKKDADKDVDETEVKLKRQNKRKWF